MSDKKHYNKLDINIPLNILVCENNINRLSILPDNIIKYTYKENYEEYLNSFGWKYLIFQVGINIDNLNNVLNKIKQDIKNKLFYNTIVCFIDSMEIAKFVIKYFSNEDDTFITFLKLNQSITLINLWKYIKEEFEYGFDPRNIDIIYYNQNSKNFLINLFIQKCAYFNQTSIDLISQNILKTKISDKQKNCFNIIVMGELGSGKSTLVNILIGAKIAKECKGFKKVTEKINKYYLNMVIINKLNSFGEIFYIK